jgi:hypothetical protein
MLDGLRQMVIRKVDSLSLTPEESRRFPLWQTITNSFRTSLLDISLLRFWFDQNLLGTF